MRIQLAALAAALCLTACASAPPQRLLPAGPAVELTATPFFPQDQYQCGPAALATVLVADGVTVTPEALVPQVYLPERRGSLQAEMIAAARAYQRVPVPLSPQIDAIVAEMSAQRPVLVLLNLGLRWVPVWHYAVVVGYDPLTQRLLLRSGRTEREEMSLAKFDSAWTRAQRWALVVTDPERIPATATAQSWIGALAPFESLHRFEIAERGYRAAAARWPDTALPQLALGNVNAAQQQWLPAVQAYTRALSLQQDGIALNNRAHALAELGCAAHAEADLARALDQQPPPTLAASLERTLTRVKADLAAGGGQHCPAPVLAVLSGV